MSLSVLKSKIMDNRNQHIENYLDYYLEPDFNPRFGIMLTGEWGCGKTWFIKRYAKNYIELKKQHTKIKNPFLFISLYGVSSFDEIDTQIFQQLHPLLSSKGMALTGKILKGLLKTSLKIDLNLDGQADGSVSSQIPEIDLPDYLKNTNDRILIFDDLERCHLPIEAVLGYINDFVENQEMKVIILANETEIDQAVDRSKNTPGKYSRIKEKLIGKSFQVNFDFDSALESFLAEIRTPDLKDFLNKQTDKILEIFQFAGYRNLRHLQQSLWDFERFYSNMEPKFQQNPKLMQDLLRIFLAFLIEIKAGKISSSDIGKITQHKTKKLFTELNRQYYLPSNIQNAEQTEQAEQIGEKNLGSFLYKYDWIDRIFDLDIWCEFFETGFLPKSRITEILEKSKYYKDENKPIWVKLWHYTDLEDEEFEALLNQTLEQWNTHAFEVPGEILQISGLLLLFSKHGFYPKNFSEIVEESKAYIQTIELSDYYYEGTGRENWRGNSWKDLGYQPRQNDGHQLIHEFKEIQSFLDKKINESIKKRLPEKGSYLLEILKENVDEFSHKIAPTLHSSEHFYFENPVFEYINPEDFLNTILTLKNAQIKDIGYALEQRYKKGIPRLAEEIPFLRELASLLIQATTYNQGKVKGLLLEDLSEYVQEAIQRLEYINSRNEVSRSQPNLVET